VKLHLADTRIGYILPMINASLPPAMFILRRFFEDSRAKLRKPPWWTAQVASASTGASLCPWQSQRLQSSTVLTVLSVWNEFVLALIVFSDQQLMPLQVGLQTFQGTYFSEYGLMMAALSISTIPVVAVYIAFQRFIIKESWQGR
jgi:multiple sugar transport system permease protein/raffinose/stachyose/melibiose transport system permease protein